LDLCGTRTPRQKKNKGERKKRRDAVKPIKTISPGGDNGGINYEKGGGCRNTLQNVSCTHSPGGKSD